MYDYRPVRIDTGSDDDEGLLIFRDEKLVAVASRLQHIDDPDLRERWNIEAVFDRLPMPRHTFGDIEAIERWLADHEGRRA